MSERVFSDLRGAGFEARAVPVSRLVELEQDISSLKDRGLIDSEVFELYLKDFRFSPPESLPHARSLVIMAFPQPKLRLRFSYQGFLAEAIVPPTYANAPAVMASAKAALEASLGQGARSERAVLPLKALAARTGLARYGRNNITYIESHGSFHRLVAFFTEPDLGRDDWQEREALPACATCRLCQEACPASVIAEDRFLIRVERCLTFHNEMPSERPFPAAVGQQWHNAIVGCMRCQEACPYDRQVRGWVEEGEVFSEEETRYLLKGDFSGPRAKAMEEKLQRCGLDLTIFPRNLEALLNADGRAKRP
ncbi:MAG: hypothetical protein MUE65_01585 [Methanomassiliicoccales archaeon]|jgi:epoxyqueuosine reductase|nr:hypothetical protein [Methanomassiliicoccales archaeon]